MDEKKWSIASISSKEVTEVNQQKHSADYEKHYDELVGRFMISESSFLGI